MPTKKAYLHSEKYEICDHGGFVLECDYCNFLSYHPSCAGVPVNIVGYFLCPKCKEPELGGEDMTAPSLPPEGWTGSLGEDEEPPLDAEDVI